MQTQSTVLLRTIKGTAMNKGRARVWLEVPQSEIAAYGFARGERIEIEFYENHITARALEQGRRKVAGRVKNGKTICILDICFDDAQRSAMFKGARELQVWISKGHIRFTAPNIPATEA
jgi:hypothetical protein